MIGAMYTARWNGTKIAQGVAPIAVEGRLYFQAEDVCHSVLRPAADRSLCEWKGGKAEYFDIVVHGEVNRAAAWRYPLLGPIAKRVEGRFAFWQGVKIRWEGAMPAPELQTIEAQTPNVAKALGAADVLWLPHLPEAIVAAGDDSFAGYLVPSLALLVNVLATPPVDELAAHIVGARVLAERVVAWNAQHPDEAYGFVAVWGSAPPSPQVAALLRQGAVVLALSEPAIVVAAATGQKASE
jgi:uncharacterized protein (DUF427 family)